jgi:transcriptional regulator with PAS, ATPase and Fis domain
MSDPASRQSSFRWQSLFQQTADPLFVLDRRLRLVFGNQAWEAVAQMPAAEALGLDCRRPRPPAVGDTWKDILAHALTPPAEAASGQPARVRRLLPGLESRQWWQIDYLPLRRAARSGGCFLLGRIHVLSVEPTDTAPLPERLVNLRERTASRWTLSLWSASKVPAVRRLVEQARLAVQVSSPVLLVGPAGSGKQSLARAIHCGSPGREKTFVGLDCQRLPIEAIAAVLLSANCSGLGALYLREPAALPRDLQLRLAESLGSADPATAPRLLAGSQTTLEAELAVGRLMAELGCLLGTLVIEVPPLRQRLDDLPDLVDYFLTRTTGEVPAAVAVDVWEPLRSYSWPANLRELHAALATARRHAGKEPIAAAHLPAAIRRAFVLSGTAGRSLSRPLQLDYLLEEAERRLIEQALRRAGGNKTKAAQMLGIWRPRLLRRMEALHIIDREADTPEAPP